MSGEKFKIMKSDRLGRYLVAGESLARGSLIFEDVPFAIGPKPDTPAVCLGCHALWRHSGGFLCSTCEWPCCSEACSLLAQHRDNECKIFADSGARFQRRGAEDGQPCIQYDCITPLRMLLAKERDPARWENEVAVMEDHNEDRMKYATWESDDHNITRYLREHCGLAERFSEELVRKVCGILEVNSVETPLHHGPNIRGIYPKFAIMSHNCVPTITHIIKSKDNNFVVEVRAANDIKPDERLELSYTHAIGCTLVRRAHLRRSKFFDCICERCSDPTELGTEMSTLRCNKCDVGFVRDTEPLDDQSIWKCSNCDYTTTSESVTGIINLIDEEISRVEKGSLGDVIEKKEQDLKWYNNILHPNHSILIGLKFYLAQNYQDYSSTLLLMRKYELCKDVLEIISRISGQTRMRGTVLYEMHIPMVILAQKEIGAGRISMETYQEKLAEASKILKEAAEILLREDEKSYNGFVGKTAINLYKDLTETIKKPKT